LRDPSDDLALSSRNAYLTVDGRKVAPILIQALRTAENAWAEGFTKTECIARATAIIEDKKRLDGLNVNIKLDYIEMNDAESFEVLGPNIRESDIDLVILSGAINVDQTRLIDNILLGKKDRILG
jgi:pantoate--beta-alanine ligase